MALPHKQLERSFGMFQSNQREMENKRYTTLQVTENTYVPPVLLDYPEDDPYLGMYKPIYNRPYPNIDANYPFVDDSRKNRLKIWFGYTIVLPILTLFLFVKYGLRWSGRENLRKYKHALQNGAITVANHCYRHDCASVLAAIRASRYTRIPMFAPNFRTKDQFYLQIVGGIPIPPAEEGMGAIKAFNAAFDEFHRRGYWFHIFPEAKRWDWYKPIRPFQKGAFSMAYKYNMPIIPCVINYRPRTGIYRLFGAKDEPLTHVTIGEPIFPNTQQARGSEAERLRQTTHETMCRMAGIIQNTWSDDL